MCHFRSNLFVKEQTPAAIAAGYKGKDMLAYIAVKWAHQKLGLSTPAQSLLLLTDKSGDESDDKSDDKSNDKPGGAVAKIATAFMKMHKKSIKKLLSIFDKDTSGDKDELCYRLASVLMA